MATISNPGGTPSVSYNVSGTTVATISCAGTTQATAAAITQYSGHTILIATASAGHTGLLLPSSPEIGDVIEVYPSSSSSVEIFIWPSSGMSIGSNSANSAVYTNGSTGARLTYLASNLWGAIVSS